MGFGDDAPDVGDADVHPLDVLGGGHGRLELDDVPQIQEPLLEDLVAGVEEPFLPFRMGR